MNLNEMIKTGINSISINDSINAPILKFTLKLNENTIAPTGNNIVITNTTGSTTTEAVNYTFNLQNPLSYLDGVTDEFVLEPVIKETKVTLAAKVIRRIEGNAVKSTPTIEEVTSLPIYLVEDLNTITTNYENAVIDIVYPKNIDFVKLFLNNTLYSLNRKTEVLTLDDIYFKDCFTDNGGDINVEFNECKVKCLSSKSGNFRIDSMGNITCNTILTTGQTEEPSLTFNQIYPVGSIYLSVNSTNPKTYFGGTWEQIKDRFLLAAGNTYSAGSTGGSASIQSHTHSIPSLSGTAASAGAHTHIVSKRTTTYAAGTQTNYRAIASPTSVKADYTENCVSESAGAHTHSVSVNGGTTGSAGSGNAGNMPPYLTVYVWKRTA